MSALNTTNTLSLQLEGINDEIRIATYCLVGLSILTMLVNLYNIFWIRKTFLTTLIYQIQQIDSLVTSVCQIGCIGILLSSILDEPNAYICTPATGLVLISLLHFLLSNLFMVTGRRMKVNAAFAGQPIPSEKSILKTFAILSACLILYLFFVTLFNSTLNVSFLPLYAACMRYNYEEAELSWHNYKLLILIPFSLIIGTNIHFDIEDNCHPIFDESSLKTSYISTLVLVIVIFQPQAIFIRHLHILITIGKLLVISLIKGPLIAIWTYHRLKQKNLKKPKQKMDVELLTLSVQEQHLELENHVLNERNCEYEVSDRRVEE